MSTPPEIPLGLAFDDVLLVPQYSEIASRSDVSTRTLLARDIELEIPLISSNMDTVTMAEMAIAMAAMGGIGFIHRFLTIEDECRQVAKVKRYRSHVIDDPYTITPDQTIADAVREMDEHQVGGLMVVDEQDRLVGIITHRDVYSEPADRPVREVMTPRERMVVASPDVSIEEARRLMHEARVEKLPLVAENGTVLGLIVMKDIRKLEANPQASLDAKGRLRVGAAVGVVGDFMERAEALVDAGADCLVVDVAHAHAAHVMKSMKQLRAAFPEMPLIGGTVATPEGVRDLVRAGSDAIRVGIGPGSACTTRMVAGAGYPQFTALQLCAEAAREAGVPIIADGGIRNPADLAKAIGAGAASAMLGRLLAGTPEAPGRVVTRDGRRYKIYRGMASMGAFISKQIAEGIAEGAADEPTVDYVPEGVEAVIPYNEEPARVIVHRLVGGLRSGMSYSNATTIPEFHERARFVRLTQAGLGESKPHVLEG